MFLAPFPLFQFLLFPGHLTHCHLSRLRALVGGDPLACNLHPKISIDFPRPSVGPLFRANVQCDGRMDDDSALGSGMLSGCMRRDPSAYLLLVQRHRVLDPISRASSPPLFFFFCQPRTVVMLSCNLHPDTCTYPSTPILPPLSCDLTSNNACRFVLAEPTTHLPLTPSLHQFRCNRTSQPGNPGRGWWW